MAASRSLSANRSVTNAYGDATALERLRDVGGLILVRLLEETYLALVGSLHALDARYDQVEPLVDLFRWLRDFGPRFGWRQTGTLTKLQTEVNIGAIGLVVARRSDDGRPGHITIVIPETGDDKAKRDGAGDVIAPLQSQAGATNFMRATGMLNWWKDETFADSAFWLHA